MKYTAQRASRAVIAIFLACAAVAARTSHIGDERPPNVVFILVDDLGWADLTCQGSTYYRTPNIDRLAGSGALFTDAYAGCAVCSPTRAAVLTGRSPVSLA